MNQIHVASILDFIVKEEGTYPLFVLCFAQKTEIQSNRLMNLMDNLHGCVLDLDNKWLLLIQVYFPYSYNLHIKIGSCQMNKVHIG